MKVLGKALVLRKSSAKGQTCDGIGRCIGLANPYRIELHYLLKTLRTYGVRSLWNKLDC